MTYFDFHGKKLSTLGMGAMRLPTKNKEIDEAATAEMIAYAIERGVNYFDTAYVYHGGKSEVVLGKLLSAYPRESYYVADKFPGFSIENCERYEEIFEEQLLRCGLDYFDFYLFHNLNDSNIGWYTEEKYGILNYLLEQKKNGRIKHLGVSCHTSLETFERFFELCGEHIEFCQLQVNYLDWNYQDVKAKIAYLNERNIPVWVMEPVRGGRLCKLPKSAESELKKLRPDETLPAWAFRFIQSVKGVGVTLSGMSNMAQLKENIKTFEESKPTNAEESALLIGIGDAMVKTGVLPCTACNYCVDGCPQGLNIPALISLYNEHRFTEGGESVKSELGKLDGDKRPASCIGCRACETVCPQGIKISETLSNFAKEV